MEDNNQKDRKTNDEDVQDHDSEQVDGSHDEAQTDDDKPVQEIEVNLIQAFGEPDGTLDEEQAECVNAVLRMDMPFMWREKPWILLWLAIDYIFILTDFLNADFNLSPTASMLWQLALFAFNLIAGSIVIAIAYRQERENTVVNGARVWRGIYKDGFIEMKSGLLLDVGADEDVYFIESLADIACVYVSDLEE